MKPTQQKCLCCGKSFIAHHAQELYCSGKCQEKKMHYNALRKKFIAIYKRHHIGGY